MDFEKPCTKDAVALIKALGLEGKRICVCLLYTSRLAPLRGACFVQCKPVEKGKEKSLAYN